MKTKVLCQSFEDFVERSLERIRKISNGEHVEPEKVISFEDPLDMQVFLASSPNHLSE